MLVVNQSLPPIKQKKRNVKNLALGSAALAGLGPDSCLVPSTPNWLQPQSTIYRNGPIEIIPGLFLGDESNASDPDTLKRFGIHFVLNVAREVENPLLDKTSVGWKLHTTNDGGSLYLKNHRIGSRPVVSKKLYWDHHQDNIIDSLPPAFRFIDLARSKHAVLIHCQCGVSRSASLVIAYLMASMKLSFESTYQLVKSRSSVISPNLGLIAQLKELQSVQ